MPSQGDHKPDHHTFDRELWLATLFFVCLLPAVWPFLLGQWLGEWAAARIERRWPTDGAAQRWASLVRRLIPLALVLAVALSALFAAQTARSYAIHRQKAESMLSLPDRDRD